MTRYHDKVFAYGARALDRCLEGVRVPTFVHLCFGYPGGLGLQHQFAYPALLDALMRTRIGGLTVEFGRSDFDTRFSRSVATGSLCSDASTRAIRRPRRWARSSIGCARRSGISTRGACCWRPIAG
jgi:hypothetical protein